MSGLRNAIIAIFLIWMLLPPVLGAFVVHNHDNKLEDWSMFTKVYPEFACAGTIETSTDKVSWQPWDARLRLHTGWSGLHLFKTPLVRNEDQAAQYFDQICAAEKGGYLRANLSCLKSMTEWVRVKDNEIVDCQNRLHAGI